MLLDTFFFHLYISVSSYYSDTGHFPFYVIPRHSRFSSDWCDTIGMLFTGHNRVVFAFALNWSERGYSVDWHLGGYTKKRARHS